MAVQYSPPTLFDSYEYPTWAYGMGWGVVMLPLIFIPLVFFYRLFADGGVEVSATSGLYLNPY